MRKEIDLTGERFGKLIVLKPLDAKIHSKTTWECLCDCGNTTIVITEDLKADNIRSCGCLQNGALQISKKISDIRGERFGHLVALEPTEKRFHSTVVWHCLCDCGKEVDVSLGYLKSGQKTSCGCQNLKLRNLRGMRFGHLVAIEPTKERYNKTVVWLCQCDCGTLVKVNTSDLLSGKRTSCTCINKKRRDITGERFGHLVALKPTENRFNYSVVWLCQCDCGNTLEVPLNYLTSNKKISCGCIKRKTTRTTEDRKMRDITGMRFGNVVVKKPTYKRYHSSVIWLCQCDCGAILEVPSSYLKKDKKIRCHCLYNT